MPDQPTYHEWEEENEFEESHDGDQFEDEIIHLFDPNSAEKSEIADAPKSFLTLWEPMLSLNSETWYKDVKAKIMKDKQRYKGFVAPSVNMDVFDTSRLNKFRASELEALTQEQDSLGAVAQLTIEGYCALSESLQILKGKLDDESYATVLATFKDSQIGDCTKRSLQLMANRFNVVTKARRSVLTKELLPENLKTPFYGIKPALDSLFDKTAASALVTSIGNAQKFREVTSPKPFRGSGWRGNQTNRGSSRGGFNGAQSNRGKRPFSSGNNSGQKRGRGGPRGARGASGSSAGNNNA